MTVLREAAKKVIFLVARQLRGGGVKGCATKDKRIFLNMALLAQRLSRIFLCQNPFPAILRRKKKSLWPLSRGGWGKGLSGRATKKITFFCGVPYYCLCLCVQAYIFGARSCCTILPSFLWKPVKKFPLIIMVN